LKTLLTLATSARFVVNAAAQGFMKSLSKSLAEGGLLSSVFLRVGKELSGAYKKKLVRNLIINQFIAGSKTRALHQNEREWIPNFMVVSPTMKWNLACTGCYSGLYRKNDELTMEELDDLFGQCRSLGIYFIVISGGEPFVKKEELSALFKKYGDMFFLVYTNGTMIDRSFARKLARLGTWPRQFRWRDGRRRPSRGVVPVSGIGRWPPWTTCGRRECSSGSALL
jgi:hypothetical protein